MLNLSKSIVKPFPVLWAKQNVPSCRTIKRFLILFSISWQWKSAVNSALIYCGDTSVYSESVVKQNNFASLNETTVVESENVFFFSFFAFLIGVGVMLTIKKPAGNV